MTSPATRLRFARTCGIVLAAALCVGSASGPARADSPRRDVQLIGLAPLYEALFAVANCRNVALDEPAFRRATRLYHLTTDDLTVGGDFAPEIAALSTDYSLRLEDDRVAFCDARRLQLAIPHGILTDLGPEVPRPLLPFAIQP